MKKVEKALRATHQGKLNISGIEISCAVLEDATRLLSERSVGDALVTKASAAYWKNKREGKSGIVPQYIAAKNLLPFINKELLENLSKSITYIAKNGRLAKGIYAGVLPEICHVWIEAKQKGGITVAQEKSAERAYILLRGFADVGIIALVDEATGFQEVRDKLALAKILEKYIAKEYLSWTKMFPEDFYKEMFRLKFWLYDPSTVKRPSIIGKYTNDVVYERLAPGVLLELQRVNPFTDKGYRKKRHHQWLTGDYGNPKLREHIIGIMALMRASANWSGFHRMLQRSYPKSGEQILLPIDD